MALDFLLDAANNDISFDETGNIVLVEGDDLVAQRVRQRLETHLNEWRFNRELGVDYLGQVFVRDPDFEVIRAHFSEVITGTPGVGEVFELTLDTNGRQLLVSARFSSGDEVVELSAAEVDGDFVWTQI